ncbi:MAG: cellulose 1,4-beta-cellobiosidase, partial [Actinomycetia bacterium]|nr:cellulose 1,4-beta-cellobiosidase [Actinomycetes bacterium]
MRRRHRWRSLGALGAGFSLLLGSLATGTGIGAAHADTVQCKVDYSKNDWGTGFTANLTITNLGTAITGWTLKYSYTGNQTL